MFRCGIGPGLALSHFPQFLPLSTIHGFSLTLYIKLLFFFFFLAFCFLFFWGEGEGWFFWFFYLIVLPCSKQTLELLGTIIPKAIFSAFNLICIFQL